MAAFTNYINGVCNRFGFRIDISRTSHASKGLPAFVDRPFLSIYEKHKDKTMVPWSGCYSAYMAARYVANIGLEGDIVECGVWRGGSSIMIAETLKKFGVTDKKVFMYDTYEGMSAPTDVDRAIGKRAWKASDLLKKKSRKAQIWAVASLEEVQHNVQNADYPAEQFILVKGDVESTIPGKAPDQISLLRLDTDWYKSTKHELVHLFPRLTHGGVIICDDYGHWAGARKAVDDYFRQHNVQIMLFTDVHYGAVTGVNQVNR